MASAYAALRSLRCTLETIKNLTRFPISIDKTQIKSLQEKVDCLINFLETFSHGGNEKARDLENRMADAAYNTEDAIESHVADEITGETTNDFDLKCFIEDLDLIKSDTVDIKRMSAVENWQSNSSVSIDLSSSTPIGKSSMVGFDNELLSIKDTLAGGESSRVVVSIVGMGGIGKTTLAKNVYEDKLIVEHFAIRVWVTISQEYDVKRIFLEILNCIQKYQTDGQVSEDQLGERIHKSLFGRKYLVVMDDMWKIESWDRLQLFFPDMGNGSRIIVTTRDSQLATHFGRVRVVHHLNFLNEDKSWNLFCEKVFGQKGCPIEELEKIGKKIARNCKGLPLSIVVIGGLLVKSAKTKEYWEYVANDLNSIANIEDNERTMKTLYLSYHSLPIHLKPCFLYMGVFPEDKNISFSEVIQLWVAEGFLKPMISKDLEVVGEEYLKDLLSRNLLINSVIGRSRVTHFKIHDILRDLCLRECQSQKFLNVQCLDTLECTKSKRRISNHKNTPEVEYAHQIFHDKDSTSCLRSLLCHGRSSLDIFPLGNPKLLRILNTNYKSARCSVEDIVSLINSRHINLFRNSYYDKVNLPSSFNLLWNLQFLKIDGEECLAPLEIWKMTQLRHVEVRGLLLPDPPTDMQDNFVLKNLHTLLQVKKFKCTEEVVKRIPNINNLNIFGEFEEDYFKNLGHLKKLESLYCLCKPPHIPSPTMFQAFPISLKKLCLGSIEFDWKDLTHIGSLPHLEELKLWMIIKCTPVWEPIKGEFSQLKLLFILSCDLVEWRADDTHFPRLEHLELHYLKKLEKIPPGIGDIPTLQSIRLENCSESSNLSAKAILDYLADFGDVGLRVYANEIPQELMSNLTRHTVAADFNAAFPNINAPDFNIDADFTATFAAAFTAAFAAACTTVDTDDHAATLDNCVVLAATVANALTSMAAAVVAEAAFVDEANFAPAAFAAGAAFSAVSAAAFADDDADLDAATNTFLAANYAANYAAEDVIAIMPAHNAEVNAYNALHY